MLSYIIMGKKRVWGIYTEIDDAMKNAEQMAKDIADNKYVETHKLNIHNFDMVTVYEIENNKPITFENQSAKVIKSFNVRDYDTNRLSNFEKDLIKNRNLSIREARKLKYKAEKEFEEILQRNHSKEENHNGCKYRSVSRSDMLEAIKTDIEIKELLNKYNVKLEYAIDLW